MSPRPEFLDNKSRVEDDKKSFNFPFMDCNTWLLVSSDMLDASHILAASDLYDILALRGKLS